MTAISNFQTAMLGPNGEAGLRGVLDEVTVLVTDAQDETSYPRPGCLVKLHFHRTDDGALLYDDQQATPFHAADERIEQILRQVRQTA